MLVPAVCAWVAGIAILPIATSALPAIGCWVVVAGLLVAAAITRRDLLAGATVCAAAAALVVTSAAIHAVERRPADLVAAGSLSDARIVADETITPGTPRFRATLVSAGERDYGGVPVLVFDGSPRERIEIGTTLVVSGSVKVTSVEDDVTLLVFASGKARVSQPPPWYLAWAGELRHGLRDAAAALPGEGASLLPGLAIGDTTGVPAELDADMKASSLSHLTAVSGANCAVIVALILLVGRALGLGRSSRIALAITALAAFVVLVTPGPSVVRAAVMAVIVLLAVATGRPVRGVPVLSIAVIVLVTIDPWLARNYGFALSVLATAGLVIVAGPLAARLAAWMPGWLALSIAVPLAAQLACQPLLLLLNPSVPLWGVVANILAEPAAPVATVLGLVACLALAAFPPAGQFAIWLAWLPAAWIAAVARFFAGLPGSQLAWIPGLPGALVLAALTVLALVAVLAPVSRRHRRLCVSALAIVSACALVFAGVSRIVPMLGRPPNWVIAACDVGQGAATFVRSAGHVALVDTGRDPKLLARCLDALGIGRIDLLVLSHFDLDHVGGTLAVNGRVDRAIVGPSSGQRRDAEIQQGLIDGGAAIDRVAAGESGQLGELRWTILWPPVDPVDLAPGNESSVTPLFEPSAGCAIGCLSAILPGDLDRRAQDRLLDANPALSRADVVEVAHHGSADQSEPFYRRVATTVALIGVGVDNGYGHPTPRTLSLLRSLGASIGRTDTQGLVLVAPDRAGSLTVWSERAVGGAG